MTGAGGWGGGWGGWGGRFVGCRGLSEVVGFLGCRGLSEGVQESAKNAATKWASQVQHLESSGHVW